MRRIAAILCSAAILASYPGIAALGQEPEIAIPVGAGVSGSSLFGQELSLIHISEPTRH